MLGHKILPSSDTLGFGLALYQLVPQLDSGVIAILFVAYAYESALFVVHEREVHGVGKGAFLKLYRCTDIDKGALLQDNSAKVVRQRQ
jgi:hypothetical protein